MEKLPADTLKQVLELRAENGLEATATAVEADVTAAKAKWTLVETPRYRRAGKSPIYVSGKYLTAAGKCPFTGETDANESKAPKRLAVSKAPATSGQINEEAFFRVLHAKGFKISMTKDLLTGELQTEIPAAIKKLDLKFSSIPGNASEIHVTQTSPQIQLSMPIDKFLEIAGIKP